MHVKSKTATTKSKSKPSLSKKIGIGIGVGIGVGVGGLVIEDVLAPLFARPSLLSRIVNRSVTGYEPLLPQTRFSVLLPRQLELNFQETGHDMFRSVIQFIVDRFSPRRSVQLTREYGGRSVQLIREYGEYDYDLARFASRYAIRGGDQYYELPLGLPEGSILPRDLLGTTSLGIPGLPYEEFEERLRTVRRELRVDDVYDDLLRCIHPTEFMDRPDVFSMDIHERDQAFSNLVLRDTIRNNVYKRQGIDHIMRYLDRVFLYRVNDIPTATILRHTELGIRLPVHLNVDFYSQTTEYLRRFQDLHRTRQNVTGFWGRFGAYRDDKTLARIQLLERLRTNPNFLDDDTFREFLRARGFLQRRNVDGRHIDSIDHLRDLAYHPQRVGGVRGIQFFG